MCSRLEGQPKRHVRWRRELRRKRLVDAAMRKHGLKSASKKARALAAAEDEADETLDFLDSRASLGEQHVRGGDLAVHLKQRADKEARLAKVLEGACSDRDCHGPRIPLGFGATSWADRQVFITPQPSLGCPLLGPSRASAQQPLQMIDCIRVITPAMSITGSSSLPLLSPHVALS